MIRVLHVIPQLDWGSEATQVLAIADDLPSPPFDLHLITNRLPGSLGVRLERAGISLHVVGSSRVLGGLPLPRTLSLVRAIEPHVIHAWRVQQSWLVGLAARFVSRAPLIVDERLPVQTCEWLADQAARLCRRLARHRVGHCPWWLPHGRRATWIPDRSLGEGTALGDSARCRKRVRHEFALDETDRLVLTVGRLVPRKRLEDAIWAADLIKVVRDDVHLFIVGGGPERARLTRYRDQVRIADRVRFLGPRDDVGDLLRAADIYWSCSELEDVPLARLEAAANGIPCILSDIHAHRVVASTAEVTDYFPLGDRAALARLTLRHLESPLAPRESQMSTATPGYPAIIAAPWTDYAALYRECLP